MINERQDVDEGSFTPSPLSLSILPRIHHVKSRPSKTMKSDLPPTPCSYHRESCATVVEAETSQHCDISEIGWGTTVASHVPGRQFSNTSKLNGHCSDSKENQTQSSCSFSTSIATAGFDCRKPAPYSKKVEVINIKNIATISPSANESDNTKISNHLASEEIICQICSKNIARYTCPKCQTLYCSVACYRVHNGGAAFDSFGKQISESEGIGSICTESFYKNRVLSEYKSLKSGDDDAKLHGILARLHRDINDGLDDLQLKEESLSKLLREGEENNNYLSYFASGLNHGAEPRSLQVNRGNDSVAEISDGDLAELAAYVLRMGDDGSSSSHNGGENEEINQRIIDSIPPHLLYAFECDLASATALSNNIDQGGLESAWKPFLQNDTPKPETSDLREKERISQRPDEQKAMNSPKKRQKGRAMTPWWMPFGEKNFSIDEGTHKDSLTLDERILFLRPLPTLHHRTTSISTLAYNIVEVLYSTAFSIRATMPFSPNIDYDEDTDIYRASLLLSHSLVLSKDTRYESVGDALSSSSEQLINLLRTIPKQNVMFSQLSWESLTSDVAKLSQNRRYVLKMLFDASDICHTAIVHIKKHLKHTKAMRSEGFTSATEDNDSMKKEFEESKKSYKLALKKIEYFQSWSSSLWTAELGQTVSDEAYAFIDNWKLPDINTLAETPVETFLRHVNDDAATKKVIEERELDNFLSGSDFFRLDLGQDDNLMKNQLKPILTTKRKLP
ncbi:hypothetical protein ACHAXS_012400 [Conticribra weissflogii]